MKPGQDEYRLLLENLPDAFAYHKVVTDSRGKPVDYIFLDINPAFEKMTGLSREKIINKKVTDVLPGIEESGFDWIGAYGKLAYSGESTRFEQFFELTNRWYNITAYSDKPGYFAVVFRDITENKKTENALAKSEALLKQTQRITRVGGWKYDVASGTIIWTDETYNIYGVAKDYNPSDISKDMSFYTPRSQEILEDAFRRAVDHGEPYDLELEFINAQGEHLWVRTIGNPEQAEGKVVSIVGNIMDITEQKHSEEQYKTALSGVRQQERETRSLLEAFRSILECETFEDAARRIFNACRKTIRAHSGYVALMNANGDENEVLFLETGGMPCNVNPQLPMPIRGLRAEAYEKVSVVYDNDFMHSRWMQFIPPGHVEIYNVMFVPLTIRGKVVGVIGLANNPEGFTENDAKKAAPFGDIAAIALQQARDKETLKESESKYRKLAESTEAIFWEYNIVTDRWTYVAPQVTRILGYLPEEWTDLTFWAGHIHPEDRKWATRYCFECTERGEEHTFEYRFLKKNGSYAWLRDVVSVEMKDGKPVKMRGFMLDITDMKQAQQKIADYNSKLEQLYSQQQEEMEKARRIHERAMPKALPEVEGISLAAHYQPAQKLGGDFYNVIQVGRKLVLYLSDVTGHGLDGTMLSVFIKEAIDSYLSLKPEAVCPRKILHHLDRQYRRENYPDDYFISIFLGVMDLQTNVLKYASAGFQTSPLVCLGNKEQCKLQNSDLPIMAALPQEMLDFREDSISLTPGSTIFFSTDGLSEQSVKGKLYNERLNKVFYQNCHLHPEATVQAINEDFRIFNNGLLQGDDDITFLVLQIDPEDKETLYLELQSNFEELDRVREEVMHYLPDRPQAQMLAAGAYELAANAVEHGNKLDPEKKVILELAVTNRFAYAVVEDEGQGFNWKEKIHAPLELQGIKERGRGIAIARQCCQRLFYNSKGNKAYLVVKYNK